MLNGYGMAGSFGGIFMILWWVLIIVGVVVLVRWVATSSGGGGGSSGDSKALEILKQRYARGEIDEQEFQKRKRDLIESPGTPGRVRRAGCAPNLQRETK